MLAVRPDCHGRRQSRRETELSSLLEQLSVGSPRGNGNNPARAARSRRGTRASRQYSRPPKKEQNCPCRPPDPGSVGDRGRRRMNLLFVYYLYANSLLMMNVNKM